jgi:hypothetical protein
LTIPLSTVVESVATSSSVVALSVFLSLLFGSNGHVHADQGIHIQ